MLSLGHYYITMTPLFTETYWNTTGCSHTIAYLSPFTYLGTSVLLLAGLVKEFRSICTDHLVSLGIIEMHISRCTVQVSRTPRYATNGETTIHSFPPIIMVLLFLCTHIIQKPRLATCG
ncbi:hypothetical protein M501DRAFT_481933 [Patellaria atrata CBS 101060]|uniref:Uncharacterized protein n=1 Tax=Patellaria atrata CBS 101060 TaxID=1346257 RepID=A0A9P4VNW4_9PEZI|nr:hypothetical protein M501DRAFT_481933 [Patellaria atrata CBS 101060]